MDLWGKFKGIWLWFCVCLLPWRKDCYFTPWTILKGDFILKNCWLIIRHPQKWSKGHQRNKSDNSGTGNHWKPMNRSEIEILKIRTQTQMFPVGFKVTSPLAIKTLDVIALQGGSGYLLASCRCWEVKRRNRYSFQGMSICRETKTGNIVLLMLGKEGSTWSWGTWDSLSLATFPSVWLPYLWAPFHCTH